LVVDLVCAETGLATRAVPAAEAATTDEASRKRRRDSELDFIGLGLGAGALRPPTRV
jgi:hypothetical protein